MFVRVVGLGVFLNGFVRELFFIREGNVEGKGESVIESEVVSRKSFLGF